MFRRFFRIAVIGFLAAALAAPAAHSDAPVLAKSGMVVSEEPLATSVGVEILRKGGNAVDAAVAVGFALAVTLPRAGNIGGGGFMVIHLAGRDQAAIDYRETASRAITARSFLDNKGEVDEAKVRNSGLAVGVPGTVAGLALAHERYGSGKFTLAELIAPAIALARDGFAVDEALADTLARAQSRLARWPPSAKIFLKEGRALGRGDRLVQSDLAATLEAITRNGPKAFYEAATADKLVAAINAAGGTITRDDLANYRAVPRAPVRGTYRGYDIVSMPPPTAGGALLIEMLNVLEGFPLGEMKVGSVDALHLLIETMKLAYADRAAHFGDPDQVNVPVAALISKRYAAARRAEIDRLQARPSRAVGAGNPAGFGSGNTTHFSIVDRDGNAVANTYTLNFNYGLGLVAEGTGVLLNNELDDFTVKPGTPNAFGLVGGPANAPAPGKRPLSSMTPTIVLKDGKPFLVTGSPGGSRIINAVLQVIVNVIDFRMTAADTVNAPRVHHQWLPDEAIVEPGVPPNTVRGLEAHGHRIVQQQRIGAASTILVTPEGLAGAADPRMPGGLAAGY
ncbi:MAG TPA: gamma-glutamyltransferase [Xanthobacteraceae bacterium]|nr:gamma-glutamyltransferase [Xanthobacteraceae bacterium]